MHTQPRGTAAAAAIVIAAWLTGTAWGQVRIQGDAVAGKPFGVGRISIQLPRGGEPDVLGLAGLTLSEEQGRVHYPALDQRPFRTLLRGLLDTPPRTAVYFLFRGNKPLKLTLEGRTAHRFVLKPGRNNPWTHERLLGAWWQAYSPAPRLLQQQQSDYPEIVENYLRPMLGSRLKLALPPSRSGKSWQDQLGEDIGVFLGTEPIRVGIQQDRMLGRTALGEPADRPLPEPIRPPELVLPKLPEKVEIEPLATRVPAECLYMRFGNLANFLWFREQLQRWGGDLGNLLSTRGLDYEPVRRAENQLRLRQTELSKTLGATVSGLLGEAAVADMAIIGTDAFQREGAAIGVLFQGRGPDLLGREIRRQRAEALKTRDGVKEQTLEIEGHEVSLLSTPDNAVRSFYVVDGRFHLVTTSKTLVRRFLQTRSNEGSLGASPEFRHARTRMPAARGDTAFIYLSDAFFRNVTGPKYRVEMTRRLQALVDVNLVQLAVLAAAAEGKPGGSIKQLIAGGFLPGDFGPRPDGSRTVYAGGKVVDSLRGRRGRFLPIPDVEIGRVTASEVRRYERFAAHFHDEWERVDPMMIAIARRPLPENREMVTIDVRMSPLNRRTYRLLTSLVGTADKTRLVAPEDDVVFGEVILPGQRLFAGIRDLNIPRIQIGGGRIAIASEFLNLGAAIQPLMVGYVGAWGDPGLLGALDILVPGVPNAAGYAGMDGALWRRKWDRFTVYSAQGAILAKVTPRLKFEEADRPAQVRLRVGDLSETKLAPMANAWGYARSRRTSLGNIRLMHVLAQQLRVPARDCRDAAELLLDAKMVCPLRGQYVYRESPRGVKRWTSTVAGGKGGMPQGFQAPPLDWFRGLTLVAELNRREAAVLAEVEMQLVPKK